MSEVKWIKITTDIFNNRKIRQIETMPDGDSMIVIWLKLLILAGQTNDDGSIRLTPEVPYTEQMLATEFGRPLPTVRLALHTFQQFQMIEIVDDIIHVSNWEKYQSVDKLTEIREYNRIRKADYRARLKAAESDSENVRDMSGTCPVTSPQCPDTDIDKDIDKDKEINTKKKRSKLRLDECCDLISEKGFDPNMMNALHQWIEYKHERGEDYTMTGFNQFLSRIEKSIAGFGIAAVITVMDDAMSSGYKGIVWDKLDKAAAQPVDRPVMNDLLAQTVTMHKFKKRGAE